MAIIVGKMKRSLSISLGDENQSILIHVMIGWLKTPEQLFVF